MHTAVAGSKSPDVGQTMHTSCSVHYSVGVSSTTQAMRPAGSTGPIRHPARTSQHSNHHCRSSHCTVPLLHAAGTSLHCVLQVSAWACTAAGTPTHPPAHPQHSSLLHAPSGPGVRAASRPVRSPYPARMCRQLATRTGTAAIPPPKPSQAPSHHHSRHYPIPRAHTKQPHPATHQTRWDTLGPLRRPSRRVQRWDPTRLRWQQWPLRRRSWRTARRSGPGTSSAAGASSA